MLPAALVAIALASTPYLDATVEEHDIRVEVEVESQVYSYTVTNLGEDEIRKIRVDHWRCYNHAVAPGWLMDATYARLITEAGTPSARLARGESTDFNLRVSSAGATLQTIPMVIEFAGDREPIELKIWGPGERPKSSVWTVAIGLSCIALFHGAFVGVRQASRRRQSGQ